MFILYAIFVHNLNIIDMVVPKKFEEWKAGVLFRPGVKIRAFHMYRDFVEFSNGSNRRLSKLRFYDWVRDKFDNINEGVDARGIWFMIGNEAAPNTGKLSMQQFRKLTDDDFVEWFNDHYESLMYMKYHLSELRDMYREFSGELLTRQLFNKWIEYGVNYKGGVIEKKRDMDGIFIVIS